MFLLEAERMGRASLLRCLVLQSVQPYLYDYGFPRTLPVLDRSQFLHFMVCEIEVGPDVAFAVCCSGFGFKSFSFPSLMRFSLAEIASVAEPIQANRSVHWSTLRSLAACHVACQTHSRDPTDQCPDQAE